MFKTQLNEDYFMLGGLGGTEIVVIILVIVIFFGAEKIPELARGLGQGMNEFRKASDNLKNEIEKGKKELQAPPPKKEDVSTQQKKEMVEEEQEKSIKNK